MAKEKIIEVRDLKVSFYTDKGRVQAIRGVSFDLYKGETLCIVGESGSGKSVTAKTIMGILPGNGRIDDGNVFYQGEDLTKVSEDEFHEIRGKKIGMIFQDPLSSLNPIMRIGKQITEALIINGDKIQKRYDDLTFMSRITYKNRLAKYQVLRQQAHFKFDDLVTETKRQIQAIKKDASFNKNTAIAKLQQELNEAKKTLKQRLLDLKKEYLPLIANDKKVLQINEKSARVEVQAYKKKVIFEYKRTLGELQSELRLANTLESKTKIQQNIKQLKIDYINSIRITPEEAKRQAIKVMEEVGIPQAAKRFRQYPFEFSGGMRQRIVIAIALTQNPDILICDEPTTALDVTIQAQILDLIKRLQKERNLSTIFITHDLGVVANMADRVAVMYAGKIVEYGTAEDIFYNPKHPYTWSLLSSIPDIDSKEKLDSIPGTPPNMIYPPKGDAFAVRSKYAMAIDFKEEPPYFKVSDTHYAATWLLDPRSPKAEMPKIVLERIQNSLKKAGKTNG
jgi:oligopeptide transport system ATP-binding protein